MMRSIQNKGLFVFLLLAWVASGFTTVAAQVEFKATAPSTLVQGEQFRLSYVLNQEGKNLRLPDMPDFDILFGPSTSTSFSQSTINGKTTSERSVTYTYILTAKNVGTFTIPEASIQVDGANYESNALTIQVLPPDDTSASTSPGGSGKTPRGDSDASAPSTSVTSKDAFIRAIISKNSPYEQEGFTVTFRLYTTLNVVSFGRIQFPEFEGFMVEEVSMPSNRQLEMERYEGRNYYTADLRKTLLFPQRSGEITIPSGRIEMVFSVASGRKVSTFFGSQEVMVDVKKDMVTNPVTINVKPLPANKPASYSNAVGTFAMKPSISTTQTQANEAITLRLEISGTGNHKLIRNPNIQFPDNFEVYDPTVNNSVNVTTNGLTGIRTIEYMVIPRYQGDYTIPPAEFTYFDPNTKSYNTLTTPEYKLQIAKGSQSNAGGTTYVNRQDVRVEHDIRFLKTGTPSYTSSTSFFAGSWGYWLWYVVPILLLLVAYIVNRKQAIENANVALMRVKKANKIAIKRLKVAEKYLREQNKESFYEEMLRAVWGYFSDKLLIPVAQLNKNNIEAELSKYGIGDDLSERFIDILNICEFARYSPSESHAAMDEVYQNTLGAIGEMESVLKKKI